MKLVRNVIKTTRNWNEDFDKTYCDNQLLGSDWEEKTWKSQKLKYDEEMTRVVDTETGYNDTGCWTQ